MSFEEPLLFHQQTYLYQPYQLADLLNKINSPSIFSLEDSELGSPLSNISFGPIEYVFNIRVNENSRMNVLCLCLLHELFETKDYKGKEIYEKLIGYILCHDLAFQNQEVMMTCFEVRTYLVKFLFSLEIKRGTPQIVYKELMTLPQISVLLLHLIQKITGQKQLLPDVNSYEIESTLKLHLGLQIEIINNDYFIIQQQKLVEIKIKQSGLTGTIKLQDQQTIAKWKEDHYLRKTAFFRYQDITLKDLVSENRSRTNSKPQMVTTAKSIVFSERESKEQSQNSYKQLMMFDNNKIEVCVTEPCDFEKDKYEMLMIAFKQFDAVINSSRQHTKEQFSLPNSTVKNEERCQKYKHKSAFIGNVMKKVAFHNPLDTENYSRTQETTQSLVPPRILKHKSSRSNLQNYVPYQASEGSSCASKSNKMISVCSRQKRKFENKQDRVPSFILNRAKFKKQSMMVENTPPTAQAPKVFAGRPTVVFSYSSK